MTTYKYRGLSPDGAKVSGVIKAYNEYEAVAQLRQTCSVITKIEEVKETKSLNPDLGKKRIKDKELAIICSQFAIILTSGLPIVKCVEMVAAQAQNKDLRAMLYKVAEDVAGGYSLAQSFENNGTSFPATFIETVRAGEQAGTLEICFDRLHKYYDKTAKTKAKIISTLTYPAMVIVVAIIVFILLEKTNFGFELKACGKNRDASIGFGVDAKRMIMTAMLISGALIGLGGALLYLSSAGKYIKVEDVQAAEGMNGIPVALLAMNHPIGIIFTGIFIAYMQVSGFYMQTYGFTTEIVDIIVSVIVYFSAFSFIIREGIRRWQLRQRTDVHHTGKGAEK